MGVVIQTYIGVETGSRVDTETYLSVVGALLKGGYAHLPEEAGDLDAGTATLFVELEGKDAPTADDVLDSGVPELLESLTKSSARVAGGAW